MLATLPLLDSANDNFKLQSIQTFCMVSILLLNAYFILIWLHTLLSNFSPKIKWFETFKKILGILICVDKTMKARKSFPQPVLESFQSPISPVKHAKKKRKTRKIKKNVRLDKVPYKNTRKLKNQSKKYKKKMDVLGQEDEGMDDTAQRFNQIEALASISHSRRTLHLTKLEMKSPVRVKMESKDGFNVDELLDISSFSKSPSQPGPKQDSYKDGSKWEENPDDSKWEV